MSSFIHNAKHFNSVEQAFKRLAIDRSFYFPYSFKQCFPVLQRSHDHGFATINEEIKQIFDTIREISVLCVTLQYKDYYAGKLDAQIEVEKNDLMSNKKQFKGLNNIETLVALQSIDYQIEIEHLKDLRPLTDQESNALFFIKEMISKLALYIVSKLPETDKAQWSIND